MKAVAALLLLCLLQVNLAWEQQKVEAAGGEGGGLHPSGLMRLMERENREARRRNRNGRKKGIDLQTGKGQEKRKHAKKIESGKKVPKKKRTQIVYKQKKQTRKEKNEKTLNKYYGSIARKQNEREGKKNNRVKGNKATRTKSNTITKSNQKKKEKDDHDIKDKGRKKAAKKYPNKMEYWQKMQDKKGKQEKQFKKNYGIINKKQNGRKGNKETKPRGKNQRGRKSNKEKNKNKIRVTGQRMISRDTDSYTETHMCKFYDYSRKASIALTQSQRAEKTLTTIKKIEKRAKKNYWPFFDALSKATNNGTTCSGGMIKNTLEGTFKTLNNICDNTNIMEKCNPALVALLTSSTNKTLTDCKSKLRSFNDQYKKGIFEESQGDFERACPALRDIQPVNDDCLDQDIFKNVRTESLNVLKECDNVIKQCNKAVLDLQPCIGMAPGATTTGPTATAGVTTTGHMSTPGATSAGPTTTKGVTTTGQTFTPIPNDDDGSILLTKPLPSLYTIETQNFEEFKDIISITFDTPEEESMRKMIFEKNIASINANNEMFDDKQFVNKFSHLTYNETIEQYTGILLDESNMKIRKKITLRNKRQLQLKLPENFDWRAIAGAVRPVKNQGQCGSCWAFAATGAIETRHFLETWNSVDLSEQQIVDCTYPKPRDGCKGGWPQAAYSQNLKQAILASYPYTGNGNEACKTPPLIEYESIISGFSDNVGGVFAMEEALLSEGSLSVAFHVDKSFSSYNFNNVYQSSSCNEYVNHAVLITGYGEDGDGTKFWIVKNSWGTNWGLGGYFRILRGVNMCRIEDSAAYPTSIKPTGCVESPGVYICGGDNVPGGVFPGQSKQECAKACWDNPLCRFWTLRTTNNYCWLKLSDECKGGPNDQWITGTKACGNTGPQSQLSAVKAVLSSQFNEEPYDITSFPASECIDGIVNGNVPTPIISGMQTENMCHTKFEKAPWVALDFGGEVSVGMVILHNRFGCCADRLRNVDVWVSDTLPQSGSQKFTGGKLLGTFIGPGQPGRKEEIKSSTGLRGRYVVVQINAEEATYLNLQEVTAWTSN